MKKLLFLLMAIASVMVVYAQNPQSGPVTKDGQETGYIPRMFDTKDSKLYTEKHSSGKFHFRWLSIQSKDTTFSIPLLVLNLNEGPIRITDEKKLFIEFEDNSIMELPLLFAGYSDETPMRGNVPLYDKTKHYEQPAYLLTADQIQDLSSKKAVKIRIEYNEGVLERVLLEKNQLNKIGKDYENLKKEQSEIR